MTTWIIIGGAGGTAAPQLAEEQLGNFVFTLAQQYGGQTLYDVMAVLLCTSLLASYVALHNAASRYLFALGREGVAPKRVGVYHPRHLSPHVASLVITGADGRDRVDHGRAGSRPLHRHRREPRRPRDARDHSRPGRDGALRPRVLLATCRPLGHCGAVVAPLVGFVGLGVGVRPGGRQLSTRSPASTNPWVNAVPLVLVLAALGGALVTLRLRARRPSAYAALAGSQPEEADQRHRRSSEDVEYTRTLLPRRRRAVRRWSWRGPSSRRVCRSTGTRGTPTSAASGTWTTRAARCTRAPTSSARSTPAASTAHPMPSDLPDYPTWRQIRDYIRGFARQYGLYDHVHVQHRRDECASCGRTSDGT